MSADLALGVRVSSVSGFHFTGSGGLEVNVPVSVSFGPIALQGITIGLHSQTGGVALDVGATIRGSIGPVTALTDGVGFTLGMTFPDPPTGNLGPDNATQVIALLRECAKSNGATVLLATHSRTAAAAAGRVLALSTQNVTPVALAAEQ